ncbi:GDSL-type esterase/lipase family protein [Saccharothrix syringae]|uniref:GDSL-type esterase/lipase family protein n=1 Tax=Saccharothrix syringae TaxID=103733 RepID=UPI00052773DC|nr:GDSL-type esterase/lipase family protein [Saccharothrix syringae]
MPGVRRSALVGVLLVALGACTSSPSAPPASSASSTSSASPERVYVSLGDSYATGYQPSAGSSRDGFPHLVAERSGLRLVNLACSGATSAQLRAQPGCAPANRAVDAPDPADRTQLDAAVAALREHRGRVGLVTVVIGGNDLAPCARAADALGCASRAVADVRANLAAVLPALREAAGDAPIVGLTYPDVFLGAWVSPEFPDGQDLARLSVTLFRDFFNTALKAEYDEVGATFVDVTAATGGYGPLTETTEDPTYGRVPTPVARVCALTHFCALTDVHPTPAGHEAIAAAVLEATR